MKLKLSKIALALPLSALTFVSAANVETDNGNTGVQAPHIQNLLAKAQNKVATDRYFVLLEDAPVALYRGDKSGLAATSIASTHGKNATTKGKLNLKSTSSQEYMSHLDQAQALATMSISARLQRTVAVKEQFKLAINALVVELAEDEVEKLQNMPGVLTVEKEQRHQLQTDSGPKFIGGTQLWQGGSDYPGTMGEGIVVGVMDTGIASYTKGPHYRNGYDGMEMHPSFKDVADDGYDHSNPYGEGVYFGDCIENAAFCNDKLVGVISYPEITESYRNSYEIGKYGNGQDTHGHGTHTASTAAGNIVKNVPVVNAIGETGEFAFEKISGVAPHANIIAYQTCHPLDGCLPSLAVKSIEHAMANGVDVMNYSVGGPASSPWFRADSLAMLSAREAGLHISVSAGNEGRAGSQTVKSPANAPWVTTVAAYTHDRAFTEKKAVFTGGNNALADILGKGATAGISGELVYSVDVDNDYNGENYGLGVCADVNWDTMADVSGKILICHRGGVDRNGEFLARVFKSKTAKQWGAAGMILINTDDTSDSTNADYHSIPTIHINRADGKNLLAWMAEGEGHSVSFNDSVMTSTPENADIAADFTSRGPDLFNADYQAVDVAGPGVDIYAAGIGKYMHFSGIPNSSRVNGDFRFMSGTSMSSPHVAGALALMAAARPNWTPAEVQSAIMMTSHTDTYTDDDYDGELTPSTFFDAGAGSIRVNRAVNAGLVMNETEAGYMAAFPGQYGPVPADIADWHGDATKMNTPSMQKGKCLLDCTWTRTLKATKAASWAVSTDLKSAGFTVTVSPESFDLAEDEEVEITVTASANQALNEEWVFANLVLTPSDATIPTAHLPISVNFIAGLVPETMEISAMRNADSTNVPEVVTIGTDDLSVEKTALVKADVYEFSISRDMSNQSVAQYQATDWWAMPLNVQAYTQRIVVDVLSSTSPDVDVYIGFDTDLDGAPDMFEFTYNRQYFSATADSNEIIDVLNPQQGTYWLMVHNWYDLDDEGNPLTEGTPVFDEVKIAVAVVKDDDDSMMVDAPTSVAPRAEVDMRIAWNNDMAQGEKYYGAVNLGTSSEMPSNIGAIRVDLERGADDVTVIAPSDDAVAGDALDYTITIAANNTAEDRVYTLNAEVAAGTTLDNVTGDADINGNHVTWVITQIVGSVAQKVTLSVNTENVTGLVDFAPSVTHSVDTSMVSQSLVLDTVQIEGRPAVSINAIPPLVKEGETVVLTAASVTVRADDVLTYQWTQLSGPTVAVTENGNGISFTAPNTNVSFEVVVSNGRLDSLPASTVVEVEAKKSSGGSTGLFFTLFASFALMIRRRRN